MAVIKAAILGLGTVGESRSGLGHSTGKGYGRTSGPSTSITECIKLYRTVKRIQY